MSTLKLYTEEQVKEMLSKAWIPSVMGVPLYTESELLESLTPIQLPSDEWIVEYSDRVFEQDDTVGKLIWNEGAMFMKKQIHNTIYNSQKK